MLGILALYITKRLMTLTGIENLSDDNEHEESNLGKEMETPKKSVSLSSSFNFLLGDMIHNTADGFALAVSYKHSFH